jgi:hypothetical protein
VEEVKLDGAAFHVMDMLKACYDGALDNETKKARVFHRKYGYGNNGKGGVRKSKCYCN